MKGERVRWSDEQREGEVVVEAGGLADLVDFLMGSLVVVYGKQVFRQQVGVPMGTDCAPFLANLYLFVLEYKWVTGLEQTEAGRARLEQLGEVSRYIDDLFCVNGEEVVGDSIGELYRGLEVKKESKESYRTHFLDLSVTVYDKRLLVDTYDKRDDFPFAVRSYPHLSGNVHRRRAHGIVLGQLRRYGSACDNFRSFKDRLKALTIRLVRQEFDRDEFA